MKKLLILTALLAMSAQTFAGSLSVSRSADRRNIQFSEKAGNISFKLCETENQSNCREMGVVSKASLEKKLGSEKTKTVVDSLGTAAATAVGGFWGASLGTTVATSLTMLGGAPVVLGLGFAALLGGGAYALFDAFGRSPLEHKDAKRVLEDILNNRDEKVEDIDKVHELILALIEEIKEDGDVVIASNKKIDDSSRSEKARKSNSGQSNQVQDINK